MKKCMMKEGGRMSTEKDYSKYFQPPSLKDAKKRGKEDIQVHYHFEIPEELRTIGQGKNI